MGNTLCNSDNKNREVQTTQRLQISKESINAMIVSEDSTLVATGGEDCVIRLWSAANKLESLGSLEGHEGYIQCLAIQGSYLISGAADSTVRKWDMAALRCLNIYEGHSSRINRIICNHKLIITSSIDKRVNIWSLSPSSGELNQKPKASLKGHTSGVHSIIYIPADDVLSNYNSESLFNPADILLTASADCTIRSWNLDTEKVLKTFRGHTGPVTCMQTDPIAKFLYSGSFDKTIRVWNISTGHCVRALTGHEGAVLCLEVLKAKLYSGSQDGTARCWISDRGNNIAKFQGHRHSVVKIKVYRGVLFTASGDGNIRAFETKTGYLLHVFEGHECAISAMAIANNVLCATSRNGNLFTWDLSNLESFRQEDDPLSQSQADRRKRVENKQSKLLREVEDSLDVYYPDNEPDLQLWK